MKLLIADDEAIIRQSFVKRIHRANIMFDQILEAKNGLEALEIVKNDSIDIMLIDINMPFLNGLELMKQIRQWNQSLIMIVISGYNDFSFAQEAIQYGIFRYLLKPVKAEELLETIQLAKEKIGTKKAVKYSAIILQIQSEINKNFGLESYSLKDLATSLGLSEGHLNKRLKQELSLTFNDLLTKVRIEHAKNMIANEGIAVKMYEVAEICGFSNQHYFSQVFKKIVGVPPKTYAQNPGKYD